MSELEPTRTYSNRTGLDPATLARSLRTAAGDGSIELVCEPIQASVLLDVADALAENAKLRERITTQKQTVQAYRDESREWREVAEHAQADNAKLQELVRDMWHDGMCECDERGACAECEYHFPDRMRELGIEVPE